MCESFLFLKCRYLDAIIIYLYSEKGYPGDCFICMKKNVRVNKHTVSVLKIKTGQKNCPGELLQTSMCNICIITCGSNEPPPVAAIL